MVDEEPPAYRPRRAFPSDPPDDEPTVAVSEPPPPPQPPAPSSLPGRGNDEPTIHLADDEDAPKPLYRDEAPSTLAAPGGATPPAGRSATSAARRGDAAPRRSATSPSTAYGGDETQILSRARQRAEASRGVGAPSTGRPTSRPSRRTADADTTTVLPRTATGARVPRRPDEIDDDIDEGGGHGRMALLVGIVAAVVLIGLVGGYFLIKLSQPTAAPGTTRPPTSGPSATSDPSGSASPSAAAAILSDASLITADATKTLDPDRTWKVALTQRNLTADSPSPVCLQDGPADGQPSAQQTFLRLISASGTDAPGVLHEALAYSTPEEAAQAYTLMQKTIGGCQLTGAFITQGRTVSGLGDQATGVVVSVTEAGKVTYRSLTMARTGRVVDLVDVAQPSSAVSFNRLVEVAGTAVKTQCAAAGGACAEDPSSKPGPPPAGDQPGYLTSGDLPPVGTGQATWVGVTPGLPDDGSKYSNCERVDFAKTDATARAKRTYLLDGDASGFGLDEVIITTKNDKAASDLATSIRKDWESCQSRGLTATVPKPTAVDGVGAKSAELSGWVTTVTQKAGTTSTKYRVGVVSVGSKLVYTFVNTKPDMDFTDDQFAIVAVRAGQRATQVN